jgi:Cu2+-exporting ATPase
VFEFAAATRRRVRENLAWAFCYNLVAIPLAALGMLNPLFAAVAMAGSSLLVVANSTRGLAATPSVVTKISTDTGSQTVPADGGSHA